MYNERITRDLRSPFSIDNVQGPPGTMADHFKRESCSSRSILFQERNERYMRAPRIFSSSWNAEDSDSRNESGIQEGIGETSPSPCWNSNSTHRCFTAVAWIIRDKGDGTKGQSDMQTNVSIIQRSPRPGRLFDSLKLPPITASNVSPDRISLILKENARCSVQIFA